MVCRREHTCSACLLWGEGDCRSGGHRLGTEEPLPSHSTKLHQLGGSRQAPVIPCQWRGGLAPLTEGSVTLSQDWPSDAWWDMLGLAGESGMVAPVTAVPVISCALT